MYHYRYDCMSAYYDYHIEKHPQQDLIDRNITWVKCEPFSISDCWIFRLNYKPENLPSYITYIGETFNFSDETQEK